MDHGAKKKQGTGVSKGGWGGPLIFESWLGREGMNEAYGEEAYGRKACDY